MKKTHLVSEYLMPYFYNYLSKTKGLSVHTILSYRDTLKLLLRFLSDNLKQSLDHLTIEELDEKMILNFLDYMEKNKGSSTATRNSRLAGLRSFFGFVGREAPEILNQSRKIRLIPTKRTEHKIIEYLDCGEMEVMFDAVDSSSRTGLRDRALLLTLYNTGARVKEVVDLTLEDLKLDPPCQVKMLGKGRKRRACPLWPETVEALKLYIENRHPRDTSNRQLFLNANAESITRFGVRHIIKTYAEKAALQCPTLKDKSISPHTFRHSTAMHLLQAGNDINMVRLWLGHANINTTHVYVEMDMDMKRKILRTTTPPTSSDKQGRPQKWQNPDILEWLDNLSRQMSAD
jgi:site-specific recombinase XerD